MGEWWHEGLIGLALRLFHSCGFKKPTDCPSQKIPSESLLDRIYVGRAKVDAAQLSLV